MLVIICVFYIYESLVCMYVCSRVWLRGVEAVREGSVVCVSACMLCQVLSSLFERHKGLTMLHGDYTGRPAGS